MPLLRSIPAMGVLADKLSSTTAGRDAIDQAEYT